MTVFNFREEVRWRWGHLSSINVIYFSSHLCKPVHEIQQASRSVSLPVQAQKQHLLLLLQQKKQISDRKEGRKKYNLDGFLLSEMQPNAKNLILQSLSLMQRASKTTTKSWPCSHHGRLRTKGCLDLITPLWKQPQIWIQSQKSSKLFCSK